MKTSLNAKQIDTFQNLHNLALKLKIREGLIDINETSISWLNIADIKISDSLILMNDNNLVLDALLQFRSMTFKNFTSFFRHLEIIEKKLKKLNLI